MDVEEKRHFKRYKKRSNFDLLIDGKRFRAETLDYSLTGIQAMVDNVPVLKEGIVLDINISAPSISTSAKVLWSRRYSSGFKIGLVNTGDLKGDLTDFALADTLIGLQRSNKTGILEVRSGENVKKVYIKNGDMIFAASNRDEDRLGDILLKERKINAEQFKRSVEEMKRANVRQGTALVRLGYLKPEELVRAVQHQVEEIIISLFAFEDGTFEFANAPLPANEVITLKLSVANIIYRGITRIDIPKIILLNLPPMDSILRLSADPLNIFQNIRLDMASKKILSLVDGKAALNYITFASNLDKFDALRIIYALLSTGIIEVVTEKVKEDDIQEVTAEEIIEESEIGADTEIVKMIEDMYSKHKTLGYYGALGLNQYAAHSDIKRAYYAEAKKFHPDKHFYLQSEDLKNKLSDIFAYITEAFAVLSNPEKRREYDRQLANKGSKTLSNNEHAQMRFNEGKVEFAKNNINDALELFGQAVYLDSSKAIYHYHYGMTLGKLNRFKEAVRAIERAINIEGANADYLAEAGHLYLKLGFQSRAKSNFEEALEISPSHARAKEGMSLI